jgi:hypothetical protein
VVWLRSGSPTSGGTVLTHLTVLPLAAWLLEHSADINVGMFHSQDRDGREVDCVLETPAGRVVGVEVRPPRP